MHCNKPPVCPHTTLNPSSHESKRLHNHQCLALAWLLLILLPMLTSNHEHVYKALDVSWSKVYVLLGDGRQKKIKQGSDNSFLTDSVPRKLVCAQYTSMVPKLISAAAPKSFSYKT